MSQSDSFFLILGDQLFAPARTSIKKGDHVVMIEDYGLCTHFKYHKSKITFFLASMREYRDALESRGAKVTYYDADHKLFKKDFWAKLEDFLKTHKKMKRVHYYEVSDHFFASQLESFLQKHDLDSEEMRNPMFLTPRSRFRDYLGSAKKPFMMTFYSSQRTELEILMDKKGKPEGGRWSYDTENRKKYPKDIEIPAIPKVTTSTHIKKTQSVVEKHFSDHPGEVTHFWLPTTRKQSLHWLNAFIDKKFQQFGPYEDAIKDDDTFGFHSVISPMLNNGLLTPDEVVEKIVSKGKENKVPLASIEGYVRQVIGWREFVRGIYDNFSEKMENDNFWGHHRKMSASWYSGETGIPPLDDSIHKAQKYGYTHHIERLMILSNMMLLCEIHPKQVYQWFMEMYVDSADWVMAANVYGMGQMSEGGIFSTKPYICGSNYILKMSNYKKGEWCDTVDGLYWRFVEKHEDFFSKNPRLSMMTRMLQKMKTERRDKIFAAAEDFIQEQTSKGKQ